MGGLQGLSVAHHLLVDAPDAFEKEGYRGYQDKHHGVDGAAEGADGAPPGLQVGQVEKLFENVAC